MKKKALLFFVYSSIIISVLGVVLVFSSKFRNNKKLNNNTPTVETSKDDNNEENETYATSLTINLPETINLYLGSTIKFYNEYVVVNPSNMIDKVNVEISSNSNDNDGLEFSNGILTPKNEGVYNLKFSVAKSKTEILSKTIVLNVHTNSSLAHLNLLKSSLDIGESLKDFELFNFNTQEQYLVETDDKITFNNDSFIAQKAGDSNVKIMFALTYIEYIYNFSVEVKDEPLYEILLSNVVDNNVELDLDGISAIQINYVVKNRHQEDIDQILVIEVEDESIVAIEKNTAPIVKIRGLKVGETDVTLIWANDTSVRLTIHVIVK